ncbi:uncharacterized protein LAESUDRAFT_809548 [Laetiporus sulphureus 93-53]|uniref:Uncharacterized protein n=1 Tax=Laetiporus sulphureus 93-53 TaxID=1314785 RepID=A0A165GNJ6_9APHY|nr:uncharacterized protein LAESUDRAFT_809548 [Laetiporus sulphureus 93-53]KZT10594.1 hypothetical protein LAESUDRAFT_809548 [Laetiporus sulphureus 93-53]
MASIGGQPCNTISRHFLVRSTVFVVGTALSGWSDSFTIEFKPLSGALMNFSVVALVGLLLAIAILAQNPPPMASARSGATQSPRRARPLLESSSSSVALTAAPLKARSYNMCCNAGISHLENSDPAYDAFICVTTKPKLTLHRYFKKNEDHRNVECRLVQLLMGHGHVGSYYHRFMAEESTQCQCRTTNLQTREHLLVHCPLYTHSRHHLGNPAHPIRLKRLFASKHARQKLAAFLTETDAFTKTSLVPWDPG